MTHAATPSPTLRRIMAISVLPVLADSTAILRHRAGEFKEADRPYGSSRLGTIP
jgi:hypothetical protein